MSNNWKNFWHHLILFSVEYLLENELKSISHLPTYLCRLKKECAKYSCSCLQQQKYFTIHRQFKNSIRDSFRNYSIQFPVIIIMLILANFLYVYSFKCFYKPKFLELENIQTSMNLNYLFFNLISKKSRYKRRMKAYKIKKIVEDWRVWCIVVVMVGRLIEKN